MIYFQCNVFPEFQANRQQHRLQHHCSKKYWGRHAGKPNRRGVYCLSDKNKCVLKFRIVMMMHVVLKLSVFQVYMNEKAQSVLASLGKAWHAASAR